MRKFRKSRVIVAAAAALCMSAMVLPGVAMADAAEGYSLSFEENVVTIESGDILGYQYDGIYTYLGIPYAHAERFEMPEKVEPWEGIKPCLTYKEISPTSPVTTVGNEKFFTKAPLSMEVQNENCQFLNVWSPDLNPDELKPVMVFIHGGGYGGGSSTECVAQDLTDMAKFGDIVGVSLNHRLNVIGFLDVSDFGEEYKYSGNAGMIDIIAALEWVRDNITAFGGDPDNVTIFGQSGGGGKVATLLGMPAAQGLFHKAIIQSGGYNGIDQAVAKETTQKLMAELGITTIEELKAVPYSELMAAASSVGASFQPVIDGDFFPEKTFENGVYTSISADIPVMIGTTMGEFSSNGVPIVGEGGQASDTSHYTDEDVLEKAKEKFGEENAEAVIEEFQKAYPGHAIREVLNTNSRAWNEEQSKGLTSGTGKDLTWSAIARSETATAPTYDYVFAYTYPIFGGVTATHGAELSFNFHNIQLFKHLTLDDPAVYDLQDVVCRAWINFAKTGDPSQDGLTWEPITAENGAVMIFDVNSEVRYFHDKQLMEYFSQAPSSSGSEAAPAAEEAESAEESAEGEEAE